MWKKKHLKRANIDEAKAREARPEVPMTSATSPSFLLMLQLSATQTARQRRETAAGLRYPTAAALATWV